MYINDGLDIVEVENVTHETDILLEKADEVRKKLRKHILKKMKMLDLLC